MLQLLEPGDEPVRIGWRLGRPGAHFGAALFQPVAFLEHQGRLFLYIRLPPILGQTRRETGGVERSQPAMPAVMRRQGGKASVRHQRIP